MNDKVSVCIATYNRANSLARALKSVQSQSYYNLEIIIVNDGSTDNTANVVSACQQEDKRILYLEHTVNKGLAVARNTAISIASGKFFTFIDDDDDWANNFIKEFLQLAVNYDETWCFICGTVYKGELGEEVHYLCNLDGSLKRYFAAGYTPPVAGQFYFTETLKKINGYNESVKNGVDHDLWLKLAIVNVKIKSLNKALSYPNANYNEDRMTTNFEKRLQGISDSLLIWKPIIKQHFGISFFNKFSQAYFQSERQSFFYRYLLHFQITKAYYVYKEGSFKLSYRSIIGVCKTIVFRILGVKVNKIFIKYADPYLHINN